MRVWALPVASVVVFLSSIVEIQPVQSPSIHYVPPCVNNTLVDISGALTAHGTHHAFQICVGEGWHHAASEDLVHWESRLFQHSNH